MGYKENFLEEVTKLSNRNSDWDYIRLEWKLYKIKLNDKKTKCICKHNIENVCLMKNVLNGNIIKVGNCCLKKFFNIDYSYLIKDIKNLELYSDSSISKKTLDFLHQENIVNDWEYTFYLDLRRRKSLTKKQLNKFININNKFTKAILTS